MLTVLGLAIIAIIVVNVLVRCGDSPAEQSEELDRDTQFYQF